MLENENLVLHSTENVEATTEEVAEQVETPEKTYTQKELDEIVETRLARNTAKIHKQYEKKYGELENVLRAGTGKEDVGAITDTFREFYQSKGISIPGKSNYTERDIEVLVKAEAEEIIASGYDEVVEEVDRLSHIGIANMTSREQALFRTLADYRRNAERGSELAKIGVTKDIYNSKEFCDFASKFSSSTPIREIYEIYNKTQSQKKVHTIGSLKNNASSDKGVKEFYTRDEALKFTKKELDKNPALVKAIENSMMKW